MGACGRGHENAPGRTFCQVCGQQLGVGVPVAAAAPAGGRRPLPPPTAAPPPQPPPLPGFRAAYQAGTPVPGTYLPPRYAVHRTATPWKPGVFLWGCAGVAAIVGAFLPWLKVTAAFVGTLTISGMEGGSDGKVTAAGGLVLALSASIAWGQRRAFVGVIALLVGAAIAVVGVIDYVDVQQRLDELNAEDFPGVASVGIGLYLTIGSGIAAAVGAFGYLVNRH